MTPVEALLHRASYHAEKLLKQRGNFNSVLWLTEYADDRREMRETWCDNAPAEASDAAILAHLADEMRAELPPRASRALPPLTWPTASPSRGRSSRPS